MKIPWMDTKKTDFLGLDKSETILIGPAFRRVSQQQ